MSGVPKNKWIYLAGFLDGDGSIYVQLKPNKSYRFRFQIAPTIAFFQSAKEYAKLASMQADYKLGYLRIRKDGIIEWIIGDEEGIKTIIREVKDHLRLKKSQAKLMEEILALKANISSEKDFRIVANRIERFRDLNYSKKRKKRTY